MSSAEAKRFYKKKRARECNRVGSINWIVASNGLPPPYYNIRKMTHESPANGVEPMDHLRLSAFN